MVVDTSVIMAILQAEPEADDFSEAIRGATVRLISAVSILESGMVAQSRKRDLGARELDDLLRVANLTIVPFDAEQARVAIEGFRNFGKGNHPAGLNFGDCASYALARVSGEPLLFKGKDFARTDVAAVL